MLASNQRSWERTDSQGVSEALDGNGDLSSGRQAVMGHGGGSARRRKEPRPAQVRQGRAQGWARIELTTVGEACRTVLRESLWKTIMWVRERAEERWSRERIQAGARLTCFLADCSGGEKRDTAEAALRPAIRTLQETS